MDIEVATVVIDCADPAGLSEFWESVTGYEVAEEGEDWMLLADPDDEARVQIGFQRVPEGKSTKNRLHLDVIVLDQKLELFDEIVGEERGSSHADRVFAGRAQPTERTRRHMVLAHAAIAQPDLGIGKGDAARKPLLETFRSLLAKGSVFLGQTVRDGRPQRA